MLEGTFVWLTMLLDGPLGLLLICLFEVRAIFVVVVVVIVVVVPDF